MTDTDIEAMALRFKKLQEQQRKSSRKYYNTKIKGSGLKTLGYRFKPETIKQLKELADKMGLAIPDVIERLIKTAEVA